MDNPQGTTQWFKDRCGNVGASRVADIMARTKSGYSASRANYMAQLIVEKLTGETQQTYTNAAMQWGIDTEPKARELYEIIYGVDVSLSGFVKHPTIEGAGASPDGLIGDDGLVEIKCPNTATHIETLLGAAIDDKYIKQMQFQMACTSRKWCDFISYDPRLPMELHIKVQRVQRDDALIAEMEKEVTAFIEELNEKINKLKGLK